MVEAEPIETESEIVVETATEKLTTVGEEKKVGPLVLTWSFNMFEKIV